MRLVQQLEPAAHSILEASHDFRRLRSRYLLLCHAPPPIQLPQSTAILLNRTARGGQLSPADSIPQTVTACMQIHGSAVICWSAGSGPSGHKQTSLT